MATKPLSVPCRVCKHWRAVHTGPFGKCKGPRCECTQFVGVKKPLPLKS
jgi:hypothetical protein